MSSKKPNQSGKRSSRKATPNMEILCKFRGKYDLNKKTKNNEINLENALTLFEIVHKKDESLFKDTNIKMFREKKYFSFGDRKGISKVKHRVPYMQVNKFFVFHRDATMIIMGVHHKTHKWFLVFQFKDVEDLTTFCDEIEGEKRPKNNFMDNGHKVSNDISQEQTHFQFASEHSYENTNFIEKISVHSEMFNERELALANFDESCFEPDPDTLNTFDNEIGLVNHSRLSSRLSSDSESSNGIHCDDLSRSKLKDLYIKTGSQMYLDEIQVEDITCINYPKYNDFLDNAKTGPVYMYCALFRTQDWNGKIPDSSCCLSSDDENKLERTKFTFRTNSNNFNHFESNYLRESDDVSHYQQRSIRSANVQDYPIRDPKLSVSNSDSLPYVTPRFVK